MKTRNILCCLFIIVIFRIIIFRIILALQIFLGAATVLSGRSPYFATSNTISALPGEWLYMP
jgi:heme A synthase